MSRKQIIGYLRRILILFVAYFVIVWLLDTLFARTRSLAEIILMAAVFALAVPAIEYITNKIHR